MNETYQIAAQKKLPIPKVTKDDILFLNGVIAQGCAEVNFADNLISLILGNLRHDEIETQSYRIYDLACIVTETINAYPFQEGERALVHWDPSRSFDFWGSPVYL